MSAAPSIVRAVPAFDCLSTDPFHALAEAEDQRDDVDAYPDEEPAICWAVPLMMLAPGRANMVVGRDGIGKTVLLQAIALGRLAGIEALGGIVEAGAPLRVRHIDVDQGVRATRRRYRRLAAGLGIPGEEVPISDASVLRWNPRRVGDWRRVLRGYDLVIVDCFAALVELAGGDENRTADTRPVLSAARIASEEEQTTIVIVGHTGHDQRDRVGNPIPQRDPRGSSAIRQGAGAIWAMTGAIERGAARVVERTRDPADDDGVQAIDKFSITIVEDASIITPGLLNARGERVCALRVDVDDDSRPPRSRPSHGPDKALLRNDPSTQPANDPPISGDTETRLLHALTTHGVVDSGNELVRLAGVQRKSGLAVVRKLLETGRVVKGPKGLAMAGGAS